MGKAWRVRGWLSRLRRVVHGPAPKCQCTYEAGDSHCDVHPGCDYCGEPIEIRRGVIMEVRGVGNGRYCSVEHREQGE